MSRSGSEQISARGKSHGLSRSRYPPLRNVTDRCGLGNPIRNNPDYGLYFNPYTSLLVFPWKPRKKRLASLARLMITILHKSQSNRVDCTGLTICGHKLYWGKDVPGYFVFSDSCYRVLKVSPDVVDIKVFCCLFVVCVYTPEYMLCWLCRATYCSVVSILMLVSHVIQNKKL